MPNWCENSLFIAGSEKAVNRFKQAVKNNVHPSFDRAYDNIQDLQQEIDNSDPDHIKQDLSFNSLVPTPYDVANGPFSPVGHNWRTKNWGTKWGASSVQVNKVDNLSRGEAGLHYIFITAWAPPAPILQATQKIPVIAQLDFYEPGESFLGTLYAEGGHGRALVDLDPAPGRNITRDSIEKGRNLHDDRILANLTKAINHAGLAESTPALRDNIFLDGIITTHMELIEDYPNVFTDQFAHALRHSVEQNQPDPLVDIETVVEDNWQKEVEEQTE